MKKLAYILLAGVLVLGTLSGCGTKDVKEETQISSAAESTAEEEMKQETAETETKAGAEGSDGASKAAAGTQQVKIHVKD